MSLRGNGTFSLDGVRILNTPDLFDIRTDERGAEYELEKIQKEQNDKNTVLETLKETLEVKQKELDELKKQNKV